MRIDLHVHTVASDGAWTPEEVVDGAVAGRLDVIAVTDHDTTAGVKAAREAAEGRNLHVIQGTELSSTWEGRELHVLGYFVDPEAPALVESQRRARSLRRRRMERMVARLAEAGVRVAMDAVVEAAGPRRSMLARPHLARALVNEGYVSSVPEAFDRYLADHHPAFIPTELQDPTRAVEVIREGGGIPVWAHPPIELLDSLLPLLVDAGLQGLEVFRPGNSRSLADRLRRTARSRDLLMSGGSDWHDPARNDPLGTFFVTSDEVGRLLDQGGL